MPRSTLKRLGAPTARIAALTLPFALTLAAVAAPLSFKDSTSLKLTYSTPWSSADLNRAITTHDGFGINLNWIDASSAPGAGHNHGGGGASGSVAELWSFITYTRLLRRWNNTNSQANLWADLGVGGVTSIDNSSPELKQGAFSAALSLDMETQRLYLAFGAKTLQALSASRNEATIKTGVALSPADYERIQPWVMVEARGMQGTSTSLELIPSLRLLHRSFAIELGASLQGHPHLNLRYTF